MGWNGMDGEDGRFARAHCHSTECTHESTFVRVLECAIHIYVSIDRSMTFRAQIITVALSSIKCIYLHYEGALMYIYTERFASATNVNNSGYEQKKRTT